MLDLQYSRTVAAAQRALTLDKAYASARQTLLSLALPGGLQNIGLRFRETDGAVYADLHGRTLVMRYDHVWLKDGTSVTRLGGRLRFIEKTYSGEDGEVVCAAFFDELGNTRMNSEGFYGSNCVVPDEQAEFLRKLSLALANAVHAKMDVIE
ncbi:hypothetical protein VSR68_32930 [Paraburkholderia phymatum]|uniref:hypothetical protein n=1 Tax=Paraburkholderia phymatum TaxID=148447 RepID=UPI0031802330